MNGEQLVAMCCWYSARINEALGEFTGNARRVARARNGQIIAESRQRRSVAAEESIRQMRDFLRRNRKWNI